MSREPDTAPPAVSAGPARPTGAGQRASGDMPVTGTVGRPASFRLTVDDWRTPTDPSYVPACGISPVVGCGSVMSGPQKSLFGFPVMLLGRGAFAAVAALGVAALTGTRFHRARWLARGTGAAAGVVFVHWPTAQSLHELDKLRPSCAVAWVVTIALFRYVAVHCLDRGLVPAPRLVREVVRDTHRMLPGAWYGVVAVLVPTRFRPYRSTLP
ncbi:vitamin K epoxide reductase family protein [Streptomyces sp. NPDC007000]